MLTKNEKQVSDLIWGEHSIIKENDIEKDIIYQLAKGILNKVKLTWDDVNVLNFITIVYETYRVKKTSSVQSIEIKIINDFFKDIKAIKADNYGKIAIEKR